MGLLRPNLFQFVQARGGGALLPDPLVALAPTGELYLDAKRSLSGLSNGTAIGQVGVTPWPDLFAHTPTREATTGVAGLRPLLRKTGANASPNGSPLVQFDGVDDTLGSSNPATGVTYPALTQGYTYLFHGRFRNAVSPPAPFNFCAVWLDAATGVRPGIGYEGNPSAPPFAVTPSEARTLHSANLGTFYGTMAWVFSAPSGGSGTVTWYLWQGSSLTPLIGSSPGTYTAWNTALAAGYQLGPNLSGNGAQNSDLGAVIWCSSALTVTQMALTHLYWYIAYGG